MKSSVLLVLALSVLHAAEGGKEDALPEAKQLQGSWSVTSVVRNQNELPAERLKDVQAVFRDGRFEFKQGDKMLTEGKFRLDPAKTAPAIDLVTTDADGKKQTTLAIYELTEGRLRICGAQPGEARPSEFSASDGSGHTLTTFERVK